MNINLPILLVEDNPDDVILIKRAFSKARIANPIHVATDGEQALNYLGAKGDFSDRSQFPLPGLILLDLKLPRVSGLEVLDWLEQQEGLRTIPVVVLTSSNQTPDIEHAYRHGANSYLVKPVNFNDMLQMVEQLGMYWMMLNELPRQRLNR